MYKHKRYVYIYIYVKIYINIFGNRLRKSECLCVRENNKPVNSLSRCEILCKDPEWTNFTPVLSSRPGFHCFYCQPSKNSELLDSETFLGVWMVWKGNALAIMCYNCTKRLICHSTL